MNTLILLPQITATRLSDSSVSITGKFLSGVAAYLARWEGPIRVVIEPSDVLSNNLDNITVEPKDLPFDLVLCDFRHPDLKYYLKGGAVALGGMDYRQNHLPLVCESLHVPFVNTSEYTLRTRKQIVAASSHNPLIKFRRYLWEHGQERANVRAIRKAEGIQCNGLPTFLAYKDINRNPLLYFDSRVETSDLISQERLTQRVAGLRRGDKLRLTFSGRLDPMKGVNHLIPFAKQLRHLGVPFLLTIYGDGSLKRDLEHSIAHSDLSSHVILAGSVDFKTELLPAIKEKTDVFVCPHVQGDPSCTYLETLSCGVPIVGFDNESLLALADLTPAIWPTPLKNTKALATKVAELHQQRNTIADASYAALNFATSHTMERTFDRRIDHLKRIASL